MSLSFPNLYPRPAKLRPCPGEGVLNVSDTLHAALADAAGPEDAVLRDLEGFRFAGGADIQAQGYRLTIAPDGIELAAADEAGARYGWQTFCQLCQSHGSNLPCLRMEDAPDFPCRAFLLDVSRCKVPTLETLRERIDQLARLRYNQLHLYTEHTFAFRGHETVWREASPYTAEDVRAVDTYCRERGIELVPCFNSFGHFERWLCHDAYRPLAESPDGFVHPLDGKRRHCGSTLRPDDASVAFLAGLYDEFLPNFRSRLFNVGGDEPWELGKGASRERVDREGEGAVYLDFLRRIHGEVSRRGRTMLFWGDLINRHPQLIPELPKDCIALNWGYEADSPHAGQLPRFREAGIPFYVCPGTSSWRSLSGRWGNAYANLANAAIEGKRNGALGYLVTDWGDGGHHQMPEISWPGMVAGGLFAWNYEANRELSVERAVDALPLARGARPPGGCGAILTALGRLAEGVSWRAANRGLFHELLFDEREGEELKELYGLAASDTKELRRALDDLRERVERLGGDGLLRDELVWTIRACRAALDRFERRGMEAAGEAGPPVGADGLMSEFRRLWLARNRPGGLAESAGYLANALGG